MSSSSKPSSSASVLDVPPYNLDRDPLSVRIRSTTGLLGDGTTTISTATTTVVASDDNTDSKIAEQYLEEDKEEEFIQSMEDVASDAIEKADRIDEQRQRHEQREEAIQQHSPAHELHRQDEEKTKRIYAEEDARVKHDLEPQRQESERLDQWLAEESARLQAEEDLRLEKALEQQQQPQQQDGVTKVVYNGEDDTTRDATTASMNGLPIGGTRSSLPPVSSSLSSFRSRLIVLYSPTTGSLQQRTQQDRAITILTAHGLGLNINGDNEEDEEVKWIDGADPMQREMRSALFEISGLRGQYPQFFRQTTYSTKAGNNSNDNDNKTTTVFLGDYDWLDYLNESGTLSKQTLVVGGVGTSTGSESKTTETTAAGVEVEQQPKTLPLSSSNGVQGGGGGGGTLNWTAPPKVTEHDGKSFVVLMSTYGSNIQQKTNQDRLKTILASNGVVALEIDASHPDNKELRNELFTLSGIRGNFPQVFVEDGDFNYTFVGGFDDLEALNDAGTLMTVLKDTSEDDQGGVEGVERVEYMVDEDDYGRGGVDRDMPPPSLASATSSDGWFDTSEELHENVSVDTEVEDDIFLEVDEASTTRSVEIQIVSDQAPGHGDLDGGGNKKKPILHSGVFTPQVGLAAAAIVAGIAVWMSRGR